MAHVKSLNTHEDCAVHTANDRRLADSLESFCDTETNRFTVRQSSVVLVNAQATNKTLHIRFNVYFYRKM